MSLTTTKATVAVDNKQNAVKEGKINLSDKECGTPSVTMSAPHAFSRIIGGK